MTQPVDLYFFQHYDTLGMPLIMEIMMDVSLKEQLEKFPGLTLMEEKLVSVPWGYTCI